MPIYEFQCKSCRKAFKTLRRSEQLSDVACPDCGDTKLARLLSVTAAQPTGNVDAAPSCVGPMAGGGCCMGSGGCGRPN